MSRRKKKHTNMIPTEGFVTTGGECVPTPGEAFGTAHYPLVPTVVVGPPPPPKKTVLQIDIGGANRGARGTLHAIIDFNRVSQRLIIHPRFIDPVPGRAEELKEEAERLGLKADAIEGRIEDVVRREKSEAPIILHIDRAKAIATVLRETEGVGRLLGWYLIMRLGPHRVLALRSLLTAEDDAALRNSILLAETVAKVSERGGSDAVFGAAAGGGGVTNEPLFRAWFADHWQDNCAKIAAGIEPNAFPLEVTQTGRETLPLHVVETKDWLDTDELGNRVLDCASFPVKRGSEFVIAEVATRVPAIRFHFARRRTDDRVTVDGHHSLDDATAREIRASDAAAITVAAPTTNAQPVLRSAEESRAALAFLARAVRDTVSVRNPIATTD
ncbi:MAG: hypothetical protein U0414_31980 [Polyangiaceae bacterium]